jgi:hypothetical protein
MTGAGGVGINIGNDPFVYAQINPIGEEGAGDTGVRIVGDDCPLLLRNQIGFTDRESR